MMYIVIGFVGIFGTTSFEQQMPLLSFEVVLYIQCYEFKHHDDIGVHMTEQTYQE